HTSFSRDWSSDVCSSDLHLQSASVLPHMCCFFVYFLFSSTRRWPTPPGTRMGCWLEWGCLISLAGLWCTCRQESPRWHRLYTSRSEERRVGKECVNQIAS